MNNKPLIPDIDYYSDSNGNLVFTKKYHLNRGYCCRSGCLNCPYTDSDKIDPNIPAEFNSCWEQEDFDEEE
jgi:hypothetical protein